MEKRAVTRKDVRALFENMGIEAGSTVLLQASLHDMPWLVGGINAIIETLMEMITPKGLLILPTFTLQALDPACMKDGIYPISQWETVRQNHPGYSSRTMPADVYEQAASAFLLHTRVKRSEHPVYSMAWWGTSGISPAMDSLDYPLSFSHILERMKDEQAVNLLVGVDIHESLYPLLYAHEKEQDVTLLQNAFIRRTKRTFEEPFLHSFLSHEQIKDQMENLDVISRSLDGLPVYKVMQPARLSMSFETDSSTS